jgi:Phospholipase_D-nuclease N-terminal
MGNIGVAELLACLIGLGALALWISMLVEAITKEKPESQDRLIWVLVVVLGGPLGALIYLFVRRPERIRELGR